MGSVSAVFFGIMNGTFDDGLPSDCSTRPYGSFIFILKVLASTASKPATEPIIFWPIESVARPALDRGDAVLRGDRLAVASRPGRRAA